MARLPLRRNKSSLYPDEFSLIRVPGPVIAKIKKGTEQQERKNQRGEKYKVVGKDLNDHFRFSPRDKSPSYTDYDTDKDGLRLDQIFNSMYENGKPNHISCKVMGFDHLQAYDISNPKDKAFVQAQLARWAVAYVRNSSGTLLIETDASCSWVSKIRGKTGFLEYLETGEMETPVVLNEKSHPNFNNKIPEGIECYEVNGRLMNWSYIGNLYIYQREFSSRSGASGSIIFETSSRIDIESITADLEYIVNLTGNQIPLSSIPLILYRMKSEITSPGFGDGHISTRRANRVKTENWGCRLRIDDEFMSEVHKMKAAQEKLMIESFFNPTTTVAIAAPDNVNLELLSDGSSTEVSGSIGTDWDKQQEKLNAYMETGDDDMVDEGEFEEDAPEDTAPEWRDSISGVLEAEKFTAYCAEVFGIPVKEATRRAKLLRIYAKDVKESEGKITHFCRMGLFNDVADTDDVDAIRAYIQNALPDMIKEYA